MGKWLCTIALLLLVLPGCGSNETPTRKNDLTPLTAIVITSSVVTLPLPAGVSTQLTATGNFSGLFTRDITSQVVWSSNQPLTADFLSTPGRVKGLTPGEATITASLAGVSTTANLSVSSANLTSLTISPLLPSCPVGLSQSFTAIGTFTDGSTPDLTEDVIWSSSDVTVATISNVAASQGEAKALKIGTATISAKFGIDPPASTTLTVTAAILSSLVVTPDSLSLLSLSSRTFSATGTYSDQSTRDVTTEVTWASSAPTVAAVATASTVKALTPGTSTITATLGEKSGSANLKVTGGILTGIVLPLDQQPQHVVLIKDSIQRITVQGAFDNGTLRDITGAVTWTVVDSTNASVTPISGNLAWVQALVVTPLDTPAKITATHGSVIKEFPLTVSEPTLNSLSIPQTLTLFNGTSGHLSLEGNFSPASTQDLAATAVWSSASEAIAIVGNVGLDKGRVHAVAPGSVVITATYGGQTATKVVTVESGVLQSLTILPLTSPSQIIAGTEKKFMVEALYTVGPNSFTQDVTADATWTIDNTNVAIFSDPVSSPGLVVAVDAGPAILTATLGEISDTETFVVQ